MSTGITSVTVQASVTIRQIARQYSGNNIRIKDISILGEKVTRMPIVPHAEIYFRHNFVLIKKKIVMFAVFAFVLITVVIVQTDASSQSPSSTTPSPTTGTIGACPPAWMQFEDQCFSEPAYTPDHFKTWDAAREACTDRGGSLASIHSPATQAFLTAAMEFEKQDVWIGLSSPSDSPEFAWTSGDPAEYFNWGREQPDGYPGSTGELARACVVMMSIRSEAGKWNDQSCDRTLPYYCQMPVDPSLTPPSGVISICSGDYVSYFDSCFKYVSKPMSFEAAEAACVADSTHLASITDAYEDAFVQTLMNENGDVSAWIGLRLSAPNDDYEWTNEWPVYYTVWGTGEPSGGAGEGCVEATTMGHWDDTNCSKAQPFICKYTEDVKPTPGPTTAGHCSGDWVEYGAHCYLFVTEGGFGLSWDGAQEDCINKNATMLTVHSTDENAFINQHLGHEDNAKDVWLGVVRNDEGGFEYINGEPLNYVNWGTGQPTDIDDEDCTIMDSQVFGQWETTWCTTVTAYGCKREKLAPTSPAPVVGACAPPWIQFEDRCYTEPAFNAETYTTWNTARDDCINMGGSLANVESPASQAFLTATMEFEKDDVWIGLSNIDSPTNDFRWTDGSRPSEYTNWGRNQPDGFPGSTGPNPEACVVMMSIPSEAGKWNDQSCDRKLPYYCEKPLDPSLTPPTDIISLCRDGYLSFFQSCFKYMYATATFANAEAACNTEMAHLASITDAYEEAFIETLMYEHGDSSAWIGLQLSGSNGDYEWTNEWPVYYTVWGTGEPSGGAGEGCVEATTMGHWDDTTCSKAQPFICKYTDTSKPTPAPIVAGYCPGDWVEYGVNCYLFITFEEQAMTWSDAQDDCDDKNATMLTVHNTDENAFIVRQMTLRRAESDMNLWLGVTRTDDGGYEYLNGEPVNYVNWATGEPYSGQETDCVIMQTDLYGHWAAANCMDVNKYGCKKAKAPPEPTSSMTSQTTSSTTAVPSEPMITKTTVQGEPEDTGGLSGGAIAGIVLACIAMAGLFATTVVLLVMRKRNSLSREKFENEMDSQNF